MSTCACMGPLPGKNVCYCGRVFGDSAVNIGIAPHTPDWSNAVRDRFQPAPQGVAEVMVLVDLLLHEQFSRVAASEYLGGEHYGEVKRAIAAIVQERDALKLDKAHHEKVIENVSREAHQWCSALQVATARIAELEGTLLSVMDSAEEWSGYVEVDHAPMSLVKHLERAIASAKEPSHD